MRRCALTALLTCSLIAASAQNNKVQPRPITMVEYEKAKKFTIKDLDNDTYAKFENTYILDRYEMRKPYFITGDDGLKKRIDIYKLMAKENMQELGTMIFYTNEKNTLYTALMPNFTADAKVWNQYFEDIHAIDKKEKNFVLKLAYVLSKECSFQLYKALNQGKDMKDGSATYGSDICFPGNQTITMADGTTKILSAIKPGDKVIAIDPATHESAAVTVKELTIHEAKNYALTQLLLISAGEQITSGGKEVILSAKLLEATPNHPMMTNEGRIKIGEITSGQQVICLDEKTGQLRSYTVFHKTEKAGGTQKVYNMVTGVGSTVMVNGVMVMQK